MRINMLAGLALFGCASLAAGAQATTQTQTTTTQTETKVVTIDGEVVRYEPGKVIVIRGTDNREVVYNLAPSVTVPSDIQVGRRVTLYTEPAVGGSTQLVKRVTSTSVTPEGQTKRTTEETRTSPSGVTTKTTTTTTSGRIASYEPGKAITIMGANGAQTTYLITDRSKIPADIVVGKTVTIMPLAGAADQTVETITVVTPPQP